MGKDTPQAPVAPDPVKTAEAQGQINQNTATTQQLLNMVDQVGPNGSLTYSQNGSTSFTGADGKTYTVPRFTATTSLTPAQQQLLDLTNKTKANLGQIGVDQSAKIGTLLGSNLKLGNEATEARIMELGSARLDPKFARDEDALRTRLANQGIQPGSAAWNAEMTQFGQGRNDAYNQLLLSGRQLADTEVQAERNAPINEITALLSGSQVSNPSFTSTPTTGVGGVDYSGMVNNNYNAATSQYNTQVGNQNAAMGGMFGLAGALGGGLLQGAGKAGSLAAFFSDRRLKSNIVPTGDRLGGLPVYEYTIFGRRERGVMADEVERVMPEAVLMHPSGFKMVDYGMLGG
ncbi:tail fiber domain-containing protein [Rhodopseudomonas sp. BR0G17]|uniref:tail fiber domain-containing protein n=1 Tax=Rhodopseudomonas sp. BR0G17 TaxID=2269368 RepID=UPI0013E0C329|nr:tail fiber domain-containing protein [Rhodopseudomonas sp. BR0G17]